jgi:hypothetical protein
LNASCPLFRECRPIAGVEQKHSPAKTIIGLVPPGELIPSQAHIVRWRCGSYKHPLSPGRGSESSRDPVIVKPSDREPGKAVARTTSQRPFGHDEQKTNNSDGDQRY